MPRRRKLASSAAAEAAMSGTFTRNRSEIFLHRTRSGGARPDPKRRHPAQIPPRNEQPHTPVKDLRLKRVFSDHKVEIEGDDRVDEKISGSDVVEVSEEPADDFVEESKQTTPPDLDTAREFDGGNDVRVFETTPPDPDTASTFDGGNDVRVFEEKDSGNLPEKKRVLSSCLRSKLIGNPNSFSYRRLLPYLKDLAEDGSRSIEIVQSDNCSVKVEKPVKEMPLLLNPASLQQNHVPTGDFLMEKAGGNPQDSDKNLAFGNPSIELANSCSASDLLMHEVATSEVGFENSMDELRRQEQEGTKKERDGSHAGILQVSDDSSPDVVQNTPPDAEVRSNSDGAEFGSRKNNTETGLSNNTSKNSLGLVSCSRSKLYRNPSSFSYRRLLPYLMDLAKNDSSGLEIVRSQTTTTKVENSEARPSLESEIPLPRQQNYVPMVNSSPEYSGEHQNVEINQISRTFGSDSQGDVKDSVAPDSQGDVKDSVATDSSTSCNKSKVRVLGVATEIPTERSDFEMLSESSFCTSIISEDLSVEELVGTAVDLSYSPMQTDMIKKEKALPLAALGRGVNHALAPRKGILKRQSRVCKGICMCLDCSSFRVHAERAYEFSRRQMSDADEVVERLMKELSYLRNLMEGCLVPTVDDPESYTVLQLNQDQLKRICRRALRVEEEAKSHVRQMFCDLNAHCKIPGPRVTFSDRVDERNVP